MRNTAIGFVAGMLFWIVFGGLLWQLLGIVLVVLFLAFIAGGAYVVWQAFSANPENVQDKEILYP